MARRTPPTVRAALASLDAATATGKDLPFLYDACPLCNTPINQHVSGTLRPLRHFDCPSCGWWLIISAAAIREAIEGAADPDSDNTAGGSNGEVWFNVETGKLILCPTEWDRKHRQEFIARAEARAQGAV